MVNYITTIEIHTLKTMQSFSVFKSPYYPNRYVIKVEYPYHVSSTSGVKCYLASTQRILISLLHTRRHFRLLLFAKSVRHFKRCKNKRNIITMNNLMGLHWSQWLQFAGSDSRLRLSWDPTTHKQFDQFKHRRLHTVIIFRFYRLSQ